MFLRIFMFENFKNLTGRACGLSGIPFESLECLWLEIFAKNHFLVFETEQR